MSAWCWRGAVFALLLIVLFRLTHGGFEQLVGWLGRFNH